MQIGIGRLVTVKLRNARLLSQTMPFVFRGHAHSLAGLLAFPVTESLGLVEINLDRPVPGHLNLFGH